MTITCPDCPAGTTGDGQLIHHKTCPFGCAVDERIAADRAWFAAHPWADHYHRPAHWTEVAEARLTGALGEGESPGRTFVVTDRRGLILRAIGTALIIASEAAR